MSEPLLPCPFCGSNKAQVELFNRPSVRCQNCYADGPPAQRLTGNPDNTEEAKTEARRRWNNRQSAPDTDRITWLDDFCQGEDRAEIMEEDGGLILILTQNAACTDATQQTFVAQTLRDALDQAIAANPPL